jgi:tRNA C32,U32 (ribose-2'-O)-methylase TrmJ
MKKGITPSFLVAHIPEKGKNCSSLKYKEKSIDKPNMDPALSLQSLKRRAKEYKNTGLVLGRGKGGLYIPTGSSFKSAHDIIMSKINLNPILPQEVKHLDISKFNSIKEKISKYDKAAILAKKHAKYHHLLRKMSKCKIKTDAQVDLIMTILDRIKHKINAV